MNSIVKFIAVIFILFYSFTMYSQKVPVEYQVEVIYLSGRGDEITIKNEKALPGIPAPIVKDESVFYNGESLLVNVKKIKIKRVKYLDIKPEQPKNVEINKVTYYNPYIGKDVTVNVIHFPQQEAAQRELERNRKSIFSSEDESINTPQEIDIVNRVSAPAKQDSLAKQIQAKVYSTLQNIYIYKPDSTLMRIDNSKIKVIDNKISSHFDGTFSKKAIKSEEKEYLEFLKLKLKPGTYIIITNLDREGNVLSYQNIPLRVRFED